MASSKLAATKAELSGITKKFGSTARKNAEHTKQVSNFLFGDVSKIPDTGLKNKPKAMPGSGGKIYPPGNKKVVKDQMFGNGTRKRKS